jgi:hypothetical protein
MIRLSQVVLNQKVIDAELFFLLVFRLLVNINPRQNPSVLVEITCLNLNNPIQQNVGYDLLHLLTELFHVPLSSLWSVHSVKTESESCESVVQVNDCLHSIAVDDLNDFSKKYFVVQSKLWSFLG